MLINAADKCGWIYANSQKVSSLPAEVLVTARLLNTINKFQFSKQNKRGHMASLIEYLMRGFLRTLCKQFLYILFIVHRPCMKQKHCKQLIIRINQRAKGFCVPDLSARIPSKAIFQRKQHLGFSFLGVSDGKMTVFHLKYL